MYSNQVGLNPEQTKYLSNENFYTDKKKDKNEITEIIKVSIPIAPNVQKNTSNKITLNVETKKPSLINTIVINILNLSNKNKIFYKESDLSDFIEKIQQMNFNEEDFKTLNEIIEKISRCKNEDRKIDVLFFVLVSHPKKSIRNLTYFCIEAGADVYQISKKNHTPLDFAAAYGDYDLIYTLIKKSPSLLNHGNSRDFAYFNSHYECAFLIDSMNWKYELSVDALDILALYLGKIAVYKLSSFLEKLGLENVPSKKLIKSFNHQLNQNQVETENLILSLPSKIFECKSDNFKKSWLAQNICEKKFTDSTTAEILTLLNKEISSASLILESGELIFTKLYQIIDEETFIFQNKILAENLKVKINSLFENTNYKELSVSLHQFAENDCLELYSLIYQDIQNKFCELKEKNVLLYNSINKNFKQKFESKILNVIIYKKTLAEIKNGKEISDCSPKVYNYILDKFIKHNEWDSIPNLQTSLQKSGEAADRFNFHNSLPSIIIQTWNGTYNVEIRNLLNTPGVAERFGLSKDAIENAAKEGKLQELLQIQLDLEKKISIQHTKIIRVYGSSKKMKDKTTIGSNTLLKAIRIAIHHFEKQKNKNHHLKNSFTFRHNHLFHAINGKTLELTVLESKEANEKHKRGKTKKGILGTYGTGINSIVCKAIRLNTFKNLACKMNIDPQYGGFDTEDCENDRLLSIKNIKDGYNMLKYIHSLNPCKEKPLIGFQMEPQQLIEWDINSENPRIAMLGEAYDADWQSGNVLSLKKKFESISSLLIALSFLHDHGIVHGDVKPQNVLIKKEENGDLQTALSDFDGSKKIYEPRNSNYITHTPCYVSKPIFIETMKACPSKEMQASNLWLEIGDVYATALTIYEFLLNFNHSFEKDEKEYVEQIKEEEFKNCLEGKAFKPLNFLLKEILTCKPAKMMSAKEFLRRYEKILPSLFEAC